MQKKRFLTLTPLILLALTLVILLWEANKLLILYKTVELSEDVIYQTQLVIRGVLDLESGLRGYVITKSTEFLEPYEKAKRVLPEELTTLRNLSRRPLNAEKSIEPMEKNVEALIEQWEYWADRLIQKIAKGDRAADVVKTQEGKNIVDTLRGVLGDILRTEEQIKNQRFNEVTRAFRITYWTFILSFLLLGFILIRSYLLRVQGEISIRQNEERFRLIVESVKDYAIFSLDPEGKIATWNVGAERMKGYRAHEVIGKHLSIFYSEEDVRKGRPERNLQSAAANGRSEDVGWRIRKDGTRFWANTVLSPIYSNKTGRLIGFSKVTRDLSEQKRVQELEEAVEARDEFLSVASHELKTPLTSLHLQQQLLFRSIIKAKQSKMKTLHSEGGPPGEILDPLLASAEKALQASSRLVILLNELLDVSRIRAGKLKIQKEPTELVALTRSVIEAMAIDLKNAGITVTFFSNAPSIVGLWDPHRLEQVVSNLVSNAIKYGEHTPIEVRVTQDTIHNKVTLTVSDQGIGIPQQLQSKIFERFERAIESSNKISGLGLGLYICQKIVQAHGGLITVESELGKGATFQVQLPWEHYEQQIQMEEVIS